jgi:hypothetical protein
MAEVPAKRAKSSGRGSKPGERRGGRKAGTPNKVSLVLKDYARQYTQDAFNALVAILQNKDEPAAARVAAANAILDRGYGKPSQHIEHGGTVELTAKEQRDAAMLAFKRTVVEETVQ